MADILQFTAGKQVVSLCGGKQSLCIAEVLAGIAKPVDCCAPVLDSRFPLPDKGEPGGSFPQGLDLTLQRSNLGSPE